MCRVWKYTVRNGNSTLIISSVNECVKGRIHPRTGHTCTKGETRYSSTLSLTSGLGEGG